MPIEAQARFATYVATLGRGPGRSRALTRAEARDAFTIALRGEADPHQLGALLMLLRYRGEDPDEIAGLVEAARSTSGLPHPGLAAELDWPSYGAGRTRGAPWFLLAALALARAGITVLMHGTNEFSAGMGVAEGLAALGMAASASPAEAARHLASARFAYLPLAAFAPGLDHLIGLRALLGLRSPANTVARLLDPGNAAAGVDGVFHPPYIRLHLGVAALLDRKRLLVLKGGGGEAERRPEKPLGAQLRADGAVHDVLLPAWPVETDGGDDETAEGFAAVWHGDTQPARPLAIVQATIGMALLALGRAPDPQAADQAARHIWAARSEMLSLPPAPAGVAP